MRGGGLAQMDDRREVMQRRRGVREVSLRDEPPVQLLPDAHGVQHGAVHVDDGAAAFLGGDGDERPRGRVHPARRGFGVGGAEQRGHHGHAVDAAAGEAHEVALADAADGDDGNGHRRADRVERIGGDLRGVALRARREHRPDSEVVGPVAFRGDGLGDGRGGHSKQAVCPQLPAGLGDRSVALPDVRAVGAALQRDVDVVVDDIRHVRGAKGAEGASAFQERTVRQVLFAYLQEGRAAGKHAAHGIFGTAARGDGVEAEGGSELVSGNH